MKLYINGKDRGAGWETSDSEAFIEATVGGDFYYGFGTNLNSPKIPMILIYKGWNSLHFITKPLNTAFSKS